MSNPGSITCDEVSQVVQTFNQVRHGNATTLPNLDEFREKIRKAEAHILDCEACKRKYSTLATVSNDLYQSNKY